MTSVQRAPRRKHKRTSIVQTPTRRKSTRVASVQRTPRRKFTRVTSVQRAPRRKHKRTSIVQTPTRSKFTRVSCVQRTPRRGNKLPAQGKRAQRATPWVTRDAFKYAPEGGKSNDRKDSLRQSRALPSPIAGITPANHGHNPANHGHNPATRRKHRHSRRQPSTNIPPVTAFAPSGGASFAPPPNPGCRIASLACPGLGACCPFGARVERMTHAYNPIAHKSFNARPEGFPIAPPAFNARPEGLPCVCHAFNARPEEFPRVCHAFNARPEGLPRVCHAFNARPEGCPRVWQAFNARPEGATSSQPRASERSERHPGLGRRISDTPPKGAKATTERIHYANRGH